MESHAYEKWQGDGTSTADISAVQLHSTACQHIDARGHRCRMLTDGSEFCLHHARQSRKLKPDALDAELLTSVDDFSSPASLNRFIGNVVRQFALRRINQRDAATFGYLGQLALTSIAARQREEALAAQAAKRASTKEDKEDEIRVIWDMPAPINEPKTPAEAVR